MRVFATVLLAASMTSIACAKSENAAKKSYCVASNEEGNWVFLTALENKSGVRLWGNFKGLKADAAEVRI